MFEKNWHDISCCKINVTQQFCDFRIHISLQKYTDEHDLEWYIYCQWLITSTSSLWQKIAIENMIKSEIFNVVVLFSILICLINFLRQMNFKSHLFVFQLFYQEFFRKLKRIWYFFSIMNFYIICLLIDFDSENFLLIIMKIRFCHFCSIISLFHALIRKSN